MRDLHAMELVRAWCNGEKFARRPRAWEQPLPQGTHAIEDLQAACETLRLPFPYKAKTYLTNKETERGH
jgi:hypothetical protein